MNVYECTVCKEQTFKGLFQPTVATVSPLGEKTHDLTGGKCLQLLTTSPLSHFHICTEEEEEDEEKEEEDEK